MERRYPERGHPGTRERVVVSGPLALVGGDEWQEGCSFDAELLSASGGDEVVVLATAAAYQRPARVVERARSWFGSLGASVVSPEVVTRRDALDVDNVAVVRRARFVYLSDGSPMHLRSVLKDAPLFDALIEAWGDGAVVAGAGAGGDVLCDPMVDPRGGAYTVGLGVIPGLAFIPRFDTWSKEKVHRTVELAPPDTQVVGVPQRTAAIREPDGSWRSAGVGDVAVWVGNHQAALADLTV